MPKFVVTKAAKRDLITIARFTEQRWGVSQRNKYLTQFDDMFHQLADNPEIGMVCDYIKPGYKKVPLASHVIFYRKITRDIEIIRILHKRMDVSESAFKV
jgi:toxin ParE1/3/4